MLKAILKVVSMWLLIKMIPNPCSRQWICRGISIASNNNKKIWKTSFKGDFCLVLYNIPWSQCLVLYIPPPHKTPGIFLITTLPVLGFWCLAQKEPLPILFHSVTLQHIYMLYTDLDAKSQNQACRTNLALL